MGILCSTHMSSSRVDQSASLSSFATRFSPSDGQRAAHYADPHQKRAIVGRQLGEDGLRIGSLKATMHRPYTT